MNARVLTQPVPYDLVLLGDSITRGWRNGGRRVWADRYGERGLNLGVPGERVEGLLHRVEAELSELSAKVVVINIGTNDVADSTPGDIAAAIDRLAHRVCELLPESEVVVLGIFPRGDARSAERHAAEGANTLLRRSLRGPRLRFLDIGCVFLDDEGNIPRYLMPDGLHLSSLGYARWAAAMSPMVEQLLRR